MPKNLKISVDIKPDSGNIMVEVFSINQGVLYDLRRED